MLDHLVVFSKGGVVLWSFTQPFAQIDEVPVNFLIKTIFLEEKTGENSCVYNTHIIKWIFENSTDLVFVAVYPKILNIPYIDKLLEVVRDKFCQVNQQKIPSFKKGKLLDIDFNADFEEIRTAFETKSEEEKTEKKGPRGFYATDKGKEKLKNKSKDPNAPQQKTGNSDKQDEEDEEDDDENLDPEERIRRNREKFLAKRMNKSLKSSTSKEKDPPTSPARRDRSRQWIDPDNAKVSKKDIENLDAAKKMAQDRGEEYYNPDKKEVEVEDYTKKSDTSDWSAIKGVKQLQESTFGNFWKKLTGEKPLSEEVLDPMMGTFQEHLTAKNVANEIAGKICESVKASLLGKKLGTFTGVKSAVKAAMEEAITRILTPKRQIEILQEIDTLKKSTNPRPYVITFCGVNGVGKSTNLAKLCRLIVETGFVPMIAACDTFRSGAVEQLELHAKRLNVQLFERGYRQDPTEIAAAAIASAKEQGKDVVLIDTAGRMQDNQILMEGLANLVYTVKPDLLIFVGEALVGNEAVDQLKKFNQHLVDQCRIGTPRMIDGIILSKFDTIDDKVGAAISMVYTTGQPIVFLGVGQTYTDLKRMNISVVTDALMSGL